ncbi:MAG: HDIG domain-containing metalloprotein [Anaerolineales bacterium]
MERTGAIALLEEFVSNQNLVRHMLAVEASMEDYAKRYDEDATQWGLAGLLHDFDWEIHPTLDKHPQEGAHILRERGISEEIVTCILSHADHTGVPRETLMQRALYACDEITGLITAVALVRPSRSILDVKPKSIRKKWKDTRFAANVSREDIANGTEALGVELPVHIENVLSSMKRIAPELGLAGAHDTDTA